MSDMKAIPGFPGYFATKDGEIYSTKSGKLTEMKRHLDKDGYEFVNLRRNKKHHVRKVHRLVLTCFEGECPEGMVACHWNDIKTDNHLGNLRWDTMESNQRDSERNGTHAKGENHGISTLSEGDVIDIYKRVWYGEDQTTLSNEYQVTKSNISCIKRGVSWGWLTCGIEVDKPNIGGGLGESNTQSMLSESEVVEIFDRSWGRESQSAISLDYGISQSLVSKIKLGKIWSYLNLDKRQKKDVGNE